MEATMTGIKIPTLKSHSQSPDIVKSLILWRVIF